MYCETVTLFCVVFGYILPYRYGLEPSDDVELERQ